MLEWISVMSPKLLRWYAVKSWPQTCCRVPWCHRIKSVFLTSDICHCGIRASLKQGVEGQWHWTWTKAGDNKFSSFPARVKCLKSNWNTRSEHQSWQGRAFKTLKSSLKEKIIWVKYCIILYCLYNFLINANASDLECRVVAPQWPFERMQVASVRTLGPNAINSFDCDLMGLLVTKWP